MLLWVKGEAESAAAGCSHPSPGSVLVEDAVWDALCSQQRPHPYAVCQASLECFPRYSQSLGLAVHSTSLGWRVGSSPALLHPRPSAPAWGGSAPNVGLWLWHSQHCCSLRDRARAGGKKLPDLHGGQDRDEFTRFYIP